MVQNLKPLDMGRFSDVQKAQSIRRQLLNYLFISIFFLLLAFSIGVIWLTQKGASELIIRNAKETVHVLAQQAPLALLTESVENADSPLRQVRSFPDVVGAGLITKNGHMLVWQGNKFGKDYFAKIDWKNVEIDELVYESQDYWHIFSVVVLSAELGDASELDLYESETEKLGYAVVSFSKQSLKDINHDLFITISIASLIAFLGLPLIVTFVIRRLLLPLQELSNVMVHNHTTGEHQKADVYGSKEVRLMAASFNAMMETLDVQDEKLRNHRDRLELDVQQRTQELVVARDAALTSNRHKSEFLANVTHELRSPIQSIIGYVELVREEAENEGLMDILADLDKVTRNAERLFALINSILDLSKIEAGRMDLHYEIFPLELLITNLKEATEPLALRNKNTLSILNDCGRAQIRVDAGKTLQILINLVGNACKFTSNGEVAIRIYFHGAKICFEVQDTGIGIANDKLERIFHKFQQVDGSESRKFGGTGLGLAISKQFCDMMKGELLVSSILEEGSIFTLKLPISITE